MYEHIALFLYDQEFLSTYSLACLPNIFVKLNTSKPLEMFYIVVQERKSLLVFKTESIMHYLIILRRFKVNEVTIICF